MTEARKTTGAHRWAIGFTAGALALHAVVTCVVMGTLDAFLYERGLDPADVILVLWTVTGAAAVALLLWRPGRPVGLGLLSLTVLELLAMVLFVFTVLAPDLAG